MEAAQIVVRRSRGKLIVIATGRTERGQKYIKGQVPLKVKSIKDTNFKGELKSAVEELLGRAA